MSRAAVEEASSPECAFSQVLFDLSVSTALGSFS